MRKKLIVVFGISASLLLYGGMVFASGDHGHGGPETLHAPTQIGLPEAAVGHGIEAVDGHGSGAAEGLTRDRVAFLVHDVQQEEEVRSIVKFALLALFFAGMILLLYPKRPEPILAAGQTPPTQQNPTV